MVEYRQELGLGNKLKSYLGVDEYNEHQKKLVRNVKYCSDNQWQWVNSYYDGDAEAAYSFFDNPQDVFNIIYDESGSEVFGPGYQHWGADARAYLKNTKFAGKEFKDKVVFYFTAKLYEEAVDEIEYDKDKQVKILNMLANIKNELNI